MTALRPLISRSIDRTTEILADGLCNEAIRSIGRVARLTRHKHIRGHSWRHAASEAYRCALCGTTAPYQ